jgi:hypothetical protein
MSLKYYAGGRGPVDESNRQRGPRPRSR